MPYKPKKPCSYPGCNCLTNKTYCDYHQSLMNHDYDKYKRNPAHKERYGKVWKRIRDSYVKTHPLCEQCLKEGRFVATQEVHHLLPLSKGGSHERSNLIALCKSCHSRIHATNGDRWHNK